MRKHKEKGLYQLFIRIRGTWHLEGFVSSSVYLHTWMQVTTSEAILSSITHMTQHHKSCYRWIFQALLATSGKRETLPCLWRYILCESTTKPICSCKFMYYIHVLCAVGWACFNAFCWLSRPDMADYHPSDKSKHKYRDPEDKGGKLA